MDKKPVNTLAYKISIGVLLAIIAVMAWMLINQKREIVLQEKDSGNIQMELQNQLDSLLTEHERVKVSYGELSNSLSERDSIINAKAREITSSFFIAIIVGIIFMISNTNFGHELYECRNELKKSLHYYMNGHEFFT